MRQQEEAGPVETRPAGKSRAETLDELMDYIKQGGSLGLEIEKRLEELPEKYVVLLVTANEEYDVLVANLAKVLCKQCQSGIYVTLNKSGKDLQDMLKKYGVDCGKIVFIDAVSRKGNAREGNVSFVDSPQDLTELRAQIEETAEKMTETGKFLVFDSLSTLLIYNAEKTTEKFVHSLGERMRDLGFKTVMVIMKGTKPETMNVLSQFTDRVIKPTPQIRP